MRQMAVALGLGMAAAVVGIVALGIGGVPARAASATGQPIPLFAPQPQLAPPSLEIRLKPTNWTPAPGLEPQRAILAAGCFWGPEKFFRETPGVVATAVGYIGGKTERPTYEQVIYEETGHAEAVIVEFDPRVITYAQVLDRFWQIHNPCTVNRQGPDVGDQYRSAIFYLDDEQRRVAQQSMKDAQKLFRRPIVTELVRAPRFWMAEDYHQQYAERTGRMCAIDRSDHIGG